MRHTLLYAVILGQSVALVSGCAPANSHRRAPLRAAVIGGMVETGFWDALVERFTAQTGISVEVVATGPKPVIDAAFRAGKADLITMHASDAIINLVADGYAMDPQPWLRNDLVIVGPPEDPAGIRGMTDAGKALDRIVTTQSRFVVHSSLGAQEVLRDVLEHADVHLQEEDTKVLLSDRARQVLSLADEAGAYTLVGRIPFLSGKLYNSGLELMVRGDPRLRRPYLIAIANPARVPNANVIAARKLAFFVREETTQQWIAEYGRGKLDEHPLFFRIER